MKELSFAVHTGATLRLLSRAPAAISPLTGVSTNMKRLIASIALAGLVATPAFAATPAKAAAATTAAAKPTKAKAAKPAKKAAMAAPKKK